jgi:hypothetical protein
MHEDSHVYMYKHTYTQTGHTDKPRRIHKLKTPPQFLRSRMHITYTHTHKQTILASPDASASSKLRTLVEQGLSLQQMGAKAQARPNMDMKPGISPEAAKMMGEAKMAGDSKNTVAGPVVASSASKRTLPQAFVFDKAKSHNIVQVSMFVCLAYLCVCTVFDNAKIHNIVQVRLYV